MDGSEKNSLTIRRTAKTFKSFQIRNLIIRVGSMARIKILKSGFQKSIVQINKH